MSFNVTSGPVEEGGLSGGGNGGPRGARVIQGRVTNSGGVLTISYRREEIKV